MSEPIKIPVVSKTGVLTFILFVLFLISVRFLYPVGDEPDFSVRAPRVLFGEHPWWSPYHILSGFLKEIDLYSECKVDAGAFSLWASIDATSCTDNINNVFIRVLTTLFVALPLLLVIVFPRILKNAYHLFKVNISNKDIVDKINVMSVCLIFPGILYYIGALAEEQLVLVLGLFSFFFAEKKIVILIIGVTIFSIDIGNSLIFFTFYLVLYAFQSNFFYRLMKYKKIMLSVLLLSILVMYFIGLEFFLNILMGIDAFHQKSESIINAYSTSDLLNKYPVYLRPVITYMSSILSLPTDVKNVFAILISILLFGNLFRCFLKRQEDSNIKLDTLYLFINRGYFNLCYTIANHEKIKSVFKQFPEKEIELTSTKTQADFSSLPYFTPQTKREITISDIVLAVKTAEYLSVGLPLLCNEYCGGAVSFVEKYGVGVVYNLIEFNSINKEKLKALMNDSITIKCKNVAAENFDYKVNALKYVTLYKTLLP